MVRWLSSDTQQKWILRLRMTNRARLRDKHALNLRLVDGIDLARANCSVRASSRANDASLFAPGSRGQVRLGRSEPMAHSQRDGGVDNRFSTGPVDRCLTMGHRSSSEAEILCQCQRIPSECGTLSRPS